MANIGASPRWYPRRIKAEPIVIFSSAVLSIAYVDRATVGIKKRTTHTRKLVYLRLYRRAGRASTPDSGR